MIRKISAVLFVLLVAAFAMAFAADSPRFRGPSGDGVFAESGLLSAWPEEGPKNLWTAEGLGESYSTVSVADGAVMLTVKTPVTGPVSFPSLVAAIETVAVSLSLIVVVTAVVPPRLTLAPVELAGLDKLTVKSSSASTVTSSVAPSEITSPAGV